MVVGRHIVARVRKMKAYNVIAALLLIAALLPSDTVSKQQASMGPKVARKVDEYSYGPGSKLGVENDCDVDAHLDNFAYYLRAEPGSRGYMVSYRGKQKRSKYFAYDPDWQFSQLTREWKFEEGRI